MIKVAASFILVLFVGNSVSIAKEKAELKKPTSQTNHEFFGIQGEPTRFSEPLTKTYTLEDGTQLKLHAEAMKGHTTSNSVLKIFAKCPKSKKLLPQEKMSICGFTHFTYDRVKKNLELHLVDYDASSAEGLCTGKKFTKTVAICQK